MTINVKKYFKDKSAVLNSFIDCYGFPGIDKLMNCDTNKEFLGIIEPFTDAYLRRMIDDEPENYW